MDNHTAPNETENLEGSALFDVHNISGTMCGTFGKDFCTGAAGGICAWDDGESKCKAKSGEKGASCTIL